MYVNKESSRKYIFGPVPSRRLGLSLGIDIIPHKICTLDCLYCEVGRTNCLSVKKEHFYSVDSIIEEFEREYISLKDSLDVVTITGSGEPTLNEDLDEIATRVKKISEHPVAILTNSTKITDEKVAEALKKFDIVVPSIDAASQDVFKKINRPEESLDIEKINEALVKFSNDFDGKLLIELLLVKDINDSETELKKISDIVKRCRYESLQLNTVFRPPAYTGTRGLNESELIDVFLKMKSFGIKVERVSNFIKTFSHEAGDEKERVFELLTMRPCTVYEVASVFGISVEKSELIINDYLSKSQLSEEEHDSKKFYFSSLKK